MNPETGHLIDAERYADLKAERARLYEPVPPELRAEAERRLNGKAEAWIPKRGRSPLARHAAERRKARRKAEKLARRRNRR